MSPHPVIDFVLPADVLETTVDILETVISTTRPACIPAYGAGQGFVVHRSGRRLSLVDCLKAYATHAVTQADPTVSRPIRDAAALLGDQLAAAIFLSFTQTKEA
jgi:hypothetical protein